MENFDRANRVRGISLLDEVGLFGGTATPSAADDGTWPLGSLYLQTGGGTYKKTGMPNLYTELGAVGGGAGGGPLSHLDLYLTTPSINIDAGWTDVVWNGVRMQTDPPFTWTNPGAEITFQTSGHFLVAASVSTDISAGTVRSESHMRVMLDTGAGYAEIAGSHKAMYNRTTTQGGANATSVFLVMAVAGDKIKVQAQRSTGTSNIILHEDGCSFTSIEITAPKGDTGAAGTDGIDGIDGADGSIWLTGTTVPSDVIGSDGDHYLRTGTGDVYTKAAGTWGAIIGNLQGPAGGGGIAEGPVDGKSYIRKDAAWQRGADFEDIRVQNGFPNQSDSLISFVDGTRTMTIAPTGASFSFWAGGTKFTKTAAENLQITNTQGDHYLYYDTTGTLQVTNTFSLAIIDDFAYVCAVHWNATDGVSIYFGEERHGRGDNEWHKWAHTTLGTQWVAGLDLTGITSGGTGNSAADAQCSVVAGAIRDEDIHLAIPGASGQVLSPAAQIPLLYRDGVSGNWRKIAATNYPITTTGTGLAAWNRYNGSAWQLAEASHNNFVLVHLIASSDKRHPVIGIIGQAEYTSRALAESGANDELHTLVLGALDGTITEWKAIATLIFQTANNKTNAVKSSIEPTESGGDYVDWRVNSLASSGASAGISDHGMLAGLSDDDHTIYHTDARGDARYDTKAQVSAKVTYETLAANGDIGTGATQVAQGDHEHSLSALSFSRAKIVAQSGSSSIPNDNTTPTVTEGTEIFAATVAMDMADHEIHITVSVQGECDNNDIGALGITVFRDSTCIGGSMALYNIKDPGEGYGPLAANIVDAPGDMANHTYSVRVGSVGGGTWYIGRTKTARWNGALSDGSWVTLMEIMP